MYCPNCGTENKDDSIYCNLCQEPLKKYTGAPSTGIPGPDMPMPPATAPYQAPVAPPPQNYLVPPGAGFGQPGPPPPPYGAAAYPGPGPGYQAGPAGPPAYPGYPAYPSQPGYPGYPPYPMVVAQGASTPGEATASLVLGIIGLVVGCFLIPLICSILAIVFGIKAKNMIDASGGYLGGRGVAQAGLVLGIIALFLYTILLIISAATGGFDSSMLAALTLGLF
jgi:hypothetical protein